MFFFPAKGEKLGEETLTSTETTDAKDKTEVSDVKKGIRFTVCDSKLP